MSDGPSIILAELLTSVYRHPKLSAAACGKLRRGRGEALLSFRRAPRGLALRRVRVRLHHAKAIAQSYRGSFGLPALLAGGGKKDAL